MSKRFAIVMSLAALLGGGCASPGVLKRLPDPVFRATRQPPRVQPRVVTPLPKPPPPVVPTPTPVAPKPSYGLRPMRSVTIVVDAGHGGKDPGTKGVSAVPEKEIVLSIAQRLAEILADAGARVITSRDSDYFVTLENRAAMADRHRADLLVSIHADSAQRASASGTTVYVARNASRQSEQAADHIVASFRRAGIESRGIHRAGFKVLVNHSRPSVLVECGFLTNRKDASLLNTAAYQEAVARAIGEGIAAHFAR